MTTPTLKATYIGKAGDFDETRHHIESLRHIADHGAPIPAVEARWLIDIATKLLDDDKKCSDIISEMHADLEAIMATPKGKRI